MFQLLEKVEWPVRNLKGTQVTGLAKVHRIDIHGVFKGQIIPLKYK